jgi:hypothetical protein
LQAGGVNFTNANKRPIERIKKPAGFREWFIKHFSFAKKEKKPTAILHF